VAGRAWSARWRKATNLGGKRAKRAAIVEHPFGRTLYGTLPIADDELAGRSTSYVRVFLCAFRPPNPFE
jgi:hypothetical protein